MQNFQQVLDAALLALNSYNTECEPPMQRLVRIWISRLEEEEHPSAKTLLQGLAFVSLRHGQQEERLLHLLGEELGHCVLCVLSTSTGTDI